MEHVDYLAMQLSEYSPTGVAFFCDQMETEEWSRCGEPATWKIVSVKKKDENTFLAALDTAYGKVALFKNDELQAVGKNSAETDEAMAIWPDYYGLNTVLFLA